MGNLRIHGGFSLLEMSLVIAIVSLMLVFGLDIGRNALRGSDQMATREKLQVIKKALDDYAELYGRLPCPAGNAYKPDDALYAVAIPHNAAKTTCDVVTYPSVNNTGGIYIGQVPTRSLNLPDNYAVDAWNNRIAYIVSNAHVTNNHSYANTTGTIEVRTGNPAGSYVTLTTLPNGTAGAAATYVVFSGGPTGYGMYSAYLTTRASGCAPASTTIADKSNCDTHDASFSVADRTTFYDNEYNDGAQAATFFDDLVVWGTNYKARTSTAAAITASGSGCASGCDTWCAQCSANLNAPAGSRQKLCNKWITSTSPCRATCYWSGWDGANYYACP